MRGHSARLALRALRNVSAPKLPAARLVPARALCVQAPAIGKETTALSGHETSSVGPTEIQSNVTPAIAGGVDAAPVQEPSVPEGGADDVEATVLSGADVAPSGVEPGVIEKSVEADSEQGVRTGTDSFSFDLKINDLSSPEEFLKQLQGLIERRAARSAMWLFRHALKQEGAPLLSEESVRIMLPIMSNNGWFESVLDGLTVAEENGFKLTVGTYNCALFAMTRTGNIKRLEDTIAAMRGTKASPNVTSYNLLIAAHFFSGTVNDAFGVLQAMKAADIYPSIATYQTLVSGCLRRRDHRRAYYTLMAIEQQGMTMSAMTVAQVLFAAANDNSHDHVSQLLGKLEETLPAYATDMDRISAKRSMYSNTKHIKTSRHHRETVRGSPRLEFSAFNAIMHSALRGGRPDIAVRTWNMFADMYPEQSHTADHWYSLIGSLAASGNFADAFDAIGHMRAAGLEPNFRDLTATLIRPLSGSVRKIDEVYFRLVEGFESNGNPVPDTGNDAVSGENAEAESSPSVEAASESSAPDVEAHGGTTGDPLDAQVGDIAADLSAVDGPAPSVGAEETADGIPEILKGERKHGEKKLGIKGYELPWADQPRAEVGMTEFNCIIAACSIAGDLDRAFQTYDEACGRFGLERNEDTLNSLMDGCVQTRHLRGGHRILDEAKKDGHLYNSETLKIAVRLLLRGLRAPDAHEMIVQARNEGTFIPARTYHMVSRQLALAGDLGAAQQVIDLGVEAGFRDSAVTPREVSQSDANGS